jgi:hypothetical protein
MVLAVNPTTLSFTTVGVPQTISVGPETGFSGSFTATSSDPSIAYPYNTSTVTGPGPVFFSVVPVQAGAVTITISDGTNTVPVAVTVAFVQDPNSVGYTAAQAITMVRLRTNETSATTLPDTSIQLLLNTALGEVSDTLGPQLKYESLPVLASQNLVLLPQDVQDVVSASFSNLPPSAPGTQVYPLEQMEQRSFMDFSGGLPGTGFGPPIAFMQYMDTNGFQIIQLYPPAFAGYVNLYYRKRPRIYADTLTSTTDMDSQAQENMVLWTCARVLESREKYELAKDFMAQFNQSMEEDKETIMRRRAPKTGQVRDVQATGRPGYPPWTSF